MIKYNDISVNKQTNGKSECIFQNQIYELYIIPIEFSDNNSTALDEVFDNFNELLINLSLNNEYILKPLYYCFDKD